MRVTTLLLLVAVASFVAASDDVLVYTDADFAAEIKQHEVALVKFYAPWLV